MNPEEEFESASPQQQAAGQLVHALLTQLHDTDVTGREARIQQTMLAIRGDEGRARRPLIPFPVMRMGAAAGIAILIAVSVVLLQSRPAMAAMDRIIEACLQPGDRTYAVKVEALNGPGQRVKRQTLYTRDGRLYVHVQPVAKGTVLVKGRNETHSWQVRPNGGVEISEDPEGIRMPMPRDLAALPFLDLHAVLQQLKVRYNITMLAHQTIAGDGTTWACLEAVKKDDKLKGAKRVKVYYHPETFGVRRILFDRVHTQGRSERKRITMDLVSQDPLPGNWFHPEAHGE
jgi:hypothetical protein